MTSGGPVIALAMLEGLVEHAFTTSQLERLAAVGRLVDRTPLSSFTDERACTMLPEVDVVVGHWGCPTLTPDALELAPRLRMLAYAAGTVKWQLSDAVWERGILVTSAAAMNAIPVAEYTLAMILLANKGVLLARELLRDPSAAVKLHRSRIGNVGKVVGIVGASFVGRTVIELLRPHDLDVAVYDPFLTTADADALRVRKVEDLDSLCAEADVLSLHAPDVDATRGMIDARRLSLLRDGATLVNTARPALVDQDALERELRSGRIAAVLDVTEPDPLPSTAPLLRLPNVFVTPHIAGAAGTELARLADLAVTEVERFARGEPPLHPVRREDLERIA